MSATEREFEDIAKLKVQIAHQEEMRHARNLIRDLKAQLEKTLVSLSLVQKQCAKNLQDKNIVEAQLKRAKAKCKRLTTRLAIQDKPNRLTLIEVD